MKILISPHAARLPTGIRNAKDYPYWQELVALLNAEGHEVVQIGLKHETRIEGVGQFVTDLPHDLLVNLIRDCNTWISVDSFLPHFCATMRLQSGIVIWGQSNPKIWGYPTNTNLLKDKRFLRQFQYAPWYDVPYIEEAFVSPETVMEALNGRFAKAAVA